MTYTRSGSTISLIIRLQPPSTEMIQTLTPLCDAQHLETSNVIERILKNKPCAQKIINALLLLNEANIMITYGLISKFADYGDHAENEAKALILLEEFEIFQTALNTFTIIEAGSKACELAMTVIWFSLNTTIPITVMSAIINTFAHALSEDKDITDLAVALAALSYILPLKSQTIKAITHAHDPMRVVNKLLSLNKDHVKLTDKRISSIATAQDDAIDQIADEISLTQLKENTAVILKNCQNFIKKTSPVSFMFKLAQSQLIPPHLSHEKQRGRIPFHPRGRTPASFTRF